MNTKSKSPPVLTENLVVKSNELITASYAMTVNEQRLLLACISQIDSRSAIEGEGVFRLTVEQARDLFYTKSDQRHAYRDLRDATERLFERKVKIDLGGNRELLTRFVQSVIFDPDQGCADIRFAKEIIPYLSQLESNFTRYRLSNVVQLTSSHAVRIYELIVSWATQGQFYKEMLIDDFRELLGLGEKYKQNGELRRFVTDKAIEQINANTDFELDIAFKKSKRTFKWIQLRFNQKADAAKLEAERKAARETRAIQNQAAKTAREEREQETAKAAELSAAEQAWAALPKDAKFLRHDGTRWEKQGDFFRCVDEGRTAHPVVAAQIWAEGFFKQVDDWRE